MKNIYCLMIIFLAAFTQLHTQEVSIFAVVENHNWSLDKTQDFALSPRRSGFTWPWRANRMNYFSWWSKKLGFRIVEGMKFRPGLRYFNQKSTLEYLADQTVFGGEIVIDEDLLNAINLPTVIERRIQDIRIELPSGILRREVQNWSSLAQAEFTFLGVSLRGSYWSGALAPRQFPQPKDMSVLLNPEELIDLAAREVVATSALNNAVSLELSIHPIQLLTGFRKLEWAGRNGFYIGSDLSFGWIKSTDLTFKQGRELLGDIDMGEEIRNVLPDPLEALINTDEAGDLLLVALESRLPLYGFGLPVATGRTFEIEGWLGYLWSNKTWSGDARLGFIYQTQQLSNDHSSSPVLSVRRWAPNIHIKWVFNKTQTESPIFGL